METKAMGSVLALINRFRSIVSQKIVCRYSTVYTNGTMRKVQKLKLPEKLAMTPIQEPDTYTSIIDMSLTWRLAAPTTEDREKDDAIKYIWGDYRKKVARTDFYLLLDKAENTILLQAYLQLGFQSTADTTAVEIFYCISPSAKNLSTDQPAPQFACSRAETNTAMFFIYSAAIITLASMAQTRNWWQIASKVLRRHVTLWHRVARSCKSPKDVLDDLEKFVIRYIYCDAKNTTLGDLCLCLLVRYTQPPLPTSIPLPPNPDDKDMDTDSENDSGDAADSDGDSNGSSGSSSDSDNP
ncbi:hypothetical protein Hamer_G014393 [Homarus americanus]|uniref:Uncharacterized protein n=1 Tax=Homarus americanus TaxID=6706 RepID=A0A8J5JYX2_HOMAM|nr:hypothetical protein Hamer_G014393 [Homarus americanus]